MSLFSWLFGKKRLIEAPVEQKVPIQRQTFSFLPKGVIGTDRFMPEGKWVKATFMAEVVGVQHRRPDVEAFVKAVALAGC